MRKNALSRAVFNKQKIRWPIGSSMDKTIKLQFLVDSGAAVSVLPSTFKAVNATPGKYKLYAANSSIINTYGQKLLSLNFGLRRSFRWAFIIADVDKPIIGADFVKHSGLLIDLKNRKLIDSLTQLKTAAEIYDGPDTHITTVCPDSAFDDLLCEFQDITRPLTNVKDVKHNVTHHIKNPMETGVLAGTIVG